MLLFQLFADNPALVIPWILALLIAITTHEFAHGFAAYKLGDDTAEKAGRLTLNPLAHLDVVGTFMLVLVGFGWARPVPINPNLIGKGRLGQFIVASAGILTNFAIAIFCIIALKLLFGVEAVDAQNYLTKFFAFLSLINLSLFIFNFIPIAPLDGYHIFENIAPRFFDRIAPFMEQYGFFILIAIVFMTNIVGRIITSFIYLISLLFGIDIIGLAFRGL
ncbi:MAG: site-2 protease family protein [Patescibacteria group bacterium]